MSKTESNFTPVDQIPAIVSGVRNVFESGKTRDLSWRKEQLRALRKCLSENKETFGQALSKDLKMGPLLQQSEINLPTEEIDLFLENLEEWASPESKSVPLLQFPAKGKIYHDPLGVVCIIAPWNYPLSLCLSPLVGAIGAGNCAIIKPSEVSVFTGEAIANLLPKYLDTSCFKVILGGVDETTALLKQKFDHIFYTGNGLVAKIIMKAAAEFLTPVTLELGGKSPCIIDKDVNLANAVPRILFGKFNNAGQTCIAPDYILIHKDRKAEFLELSKKVIKEFYGEDPKQSADYGKIINSRHCERILKLLGNHNVIFGGKHSIEDRYIEPTFVESPDTNSPLMQEEIFGPLLPIFTIESVDEAIKFVNERPKPLALYVFSNNSANADKVMSKAYFGGGAVNETLMHYLCPDLPFGGVGPSGLGAYHGKKSFEIFSHPKSVLAKSLGADPSLRFPPFTPSKIQWLARLNGIKLPSTSKIYPVLFLGLVAVVYLQREFIRGFLKSL